jgi:hypothetical protein
VRVVAVVWVGWLVLANVFLQPGIGPRLIAQHPERFGIGWTKAWTLVPGLAHVRGFWCGGHVRNTRWRIEVDRAAVLVNVPALVARTFHGLWPRASGIRATVEMTDDYVEPKQRRRPGFRVVLYGIRGTEVGDLELGGIGIAGVESVAGTLDTRARGRLSIPSARLRINDGRIDVDDETVAEEMSLDARIRIAPYVPTDHRDTGPFPFLSGRVDLSGRLGDLSALKLFLRNTPMLDFEGGRARVDGTVVLEHGHVVDPTDVTISEATYTVRYLDDVLATGTGRILAGRATGTGGEVLRFELESFELARPDTAGPYATGEDLSVRVLADRVDLLDVGDQVEIVVDIPSAEILDIGAFDAYLPATSRMRLLGGTGNLRSRIDLDLRTDAGAASLELETDDIDARVGERDLRADLAVLGEFVVRDARALRFDITTLAIDLDDVAVSGERRHRSTDTTGGWWSHTRVNAGAVRLAKPIEIDAEVTVEAMDARPIFALVEDQTAALGWVDRLVDTEDLSGSARLISSGPGVELRSLELEAGKTRISGEICVRGEQTTMVALAAIGNHHIGLERTSEGTDWSLRTPTEWFAQRRPQFSCDPSGGH